MNSFSTDSLKSDTFFTADLMLDKSFMLLPFTCPVTSTLLEELKDWSFTSVQSNGSPTSSDALMAGTQEVSIETLTVEKKPKESNLLEQATQEAKSAFEAAKNLIHANDPEDVILEVVSTVIDHFSSYVNMVYTRYATHLEIDQDSLNVIVKDLCIFVKDNQRYVLRCLDQKGSKERNFLVNHSVRSSIYAISIGMQLRRPLSELIELGNATILHEIGMIKLPAQLYISSKRLSPIERRQLFSHPVQSYNILHDFGFSNAVCRGVLEHHERENGTGYPRRISGNEITPFAKIISVACTFEALTAPRMYKDAQTSYEAMVEMLKNENKQFEPSVIKALVNFLSVFPIGSYVFLANGKIAQVVDVNPTNTRYPIVELALEKDKEGKPIILPTDNAQFAIRRPLTKKEVDDLQAMINKQA